MNVDNNASAWGLFFIYLKWISTVSFRRQQIKSIVFSRLWLFSAFLAPFYLFECLYSQKRLCEWAVKAAGLLLLMGRNLKETSGRMISNRNPHSWHTSVGPWGDLSLSTGKKNRLCSVSGSSVYLSYMLSPAPNAHNFHPVFRSRV